MQELKVIENELVPVYETDKGIKVVNGRELHQVLQSRQDFSTWVKKRLVECDAVENEDFQRFHKKMEANNATMIDYIIKLDTAKEMAMLERNEKGKEVRKYFISVERKYKQTAVDMSELSPELQMFNKIFTSVAQQQLEQKRQAQQISKLEENQKAIAMAMRSQPEESFSDWVNRCLSAIAESDNFQYVGSRQDRHRAVRAESYERLNRERSCRLEQRVQRARENAVYNGMSESKAKKEINKLHIIENDKNLKPAYKAVIKDMAASYCITVEEDV